MKVVTLKNEDSVTVSEIFRELVLKYSANDGTFRFVEVDIKEKTREHPNVFYRHMYLNFGSEVLIRKNSETLASIASFLGSDHATANHAVKKYKDEYSNTRFGFHKWYIRTYEFLREETMRLYTQGKVEEGLASLDMKAITKEEINVIEEYKKSHKLNQRKIAKLEDKVANYSEIQMSKDLENIRLREKIQELEKKLILSETNYKLIKSEHSEIYEKYKGKKNIKV